MATGNWGLKMNVNKQGVSQVLNRLSYLSTLSHIRRVQTPNSDNGKLIPQGIYMYSIEILGKDMKEFNKIGTIQVIY